MRIAAFLVLTLVVFPLAASAVEYRGNSDVCLNERLLIRDGKPAFAVSKPASYDECIEKKCTQAKEKAKICQCGRESFTTGEGGAAKSTVSRCDPNLSKLIGKAMGGDSSGMKTFEMQSLIAARIQEVDVSTADGRRRLSQILQEYGNSEAEATAKVNDETKAEAIKARLDRFVTTSNKSEANDIANELGFRLNKDLTDEVRLDPEKYAAVLKEDDFERFETAVPVTFQEVVRGVVAENLAPLCGQLGGCSDTACLSSGSLTCRTNNPGALTWAPWEAKYGGQPCGQANNTTCFPSLEHGLAAKIALLTSSRYLDGDNNTILRLLCNGYATNAVGNNCNAYATFVQNQTGIPMNQTIDPRDPEQVGKVVMAMARLENGRFVPFTPQQLENAMAMVYGGKLPNGTPGFVPQIAYGTGGSQFGSPFNFGPTAAPATVGYGSAFGYSAPAPLAPSSYSQPAQTTQATQSASSPQPATPAAVAPQPRPSAPTPTSTAATELERAIQDPSGVNAANRLVNIIVEQAEVRRGDSVQVSWTSIGMSTDKPCELRAGSNVIARMNRGTATVGTSAATSIGSLVFYLRCTTASGVTFQRTAAVMVR